MIKKRMILQPVADSNKPESEPEPTAATDAGKKSKKKGPNIMALQKRLEAQRKLEEELRQQQEEEEERRLEEERRRIEEEERAAEEARQLKKEKEKIRKEELRKQGKLLTKAQKEEKRKQEQKLQALLQSGIQVAGSYSRIAKSARSLPIPINPKSRVTNLSPKHWRKK